MPATDVFFFKGDDGRVPVLEWLNELRNRNPRALTKCLGLVRLLSQFGYELRRPRADLLRDGVYELRTEVGRVNYRILYGFVGQNVALLVGALTKEKAVPEEQIDRAVERLEAYRKAPARHRTAMEEEQDGEDENEDNE